MKKLVCLIFTFSLLSLSKSYSQTIFFDRTEVDALNANFVTAQHIFEIDIRLEGINHCSNVAFHLRHNLAEYVKYDGMNKSPAWSPYSNNYAAVVPTSTNIAGESSLLVTAGSGSLPDETYPNNPKVIHLKFAVTPSAPHNHVLTFTIDNMEAVVFRDNEVQRINVPRFSVQYIVRSFVEVWPGDANCDGIVDSKDFTVISMFYTDDDSHHTNTKKRSFKREIPTTLWQPEYCLAWDSLIGTYADCNGDGVVSVSDIFVVINNGNYTHPNPCNPPVPFNIPDISSEEAVDENTIIVPIQINNKENTIEAVAGFINYRNHSGIEIIGMKKGEFFDEYGDLFYHVSKKGDNIFFAAWTKNKNMPPTAKNNTVAYLYVKSANNTLPHQNVNDFVGLDIFGNIKELHQLVNTSSIADANLADDLLIEYSSGETLNILNCDFVIQEIKVLNLFGEIIAELSPNTNFDLVNNSNNFHIGNLSNGVYFIKIIGNNRTIMNKFYVIN